MDVRPVGTGGRRSQTPSLLLSGGGGLQLPLTHVEHQFALQEHGHVILIIY